jgi:hypothetical protein
MYCHRNVIDQYSHVCTGMYNFAFSRTASYPEEDVLVRTRTYHLVLPCTRGTGFQMKGGVTVSTVPAARGPLAGRWRWGYPARPDLAGPGGWHRARPRCQGAVAAAEVTSPGACQAVPQVARRGW